MENRSLRDSEGWMECTSHKTTGQICTREGSTTDFEWRKRYILVAFRYPAASNEALRL